MLIEKWFVGACIRMLGIVTFEKQTDGTRRTLRADPDVEWFERTDNAEETITYFRERS